MEALPYNIRRICTCESIKLRQKCALITNKISDSVRQRATPCSDTSTRKKKKKTWMPRCDAALKSKPYPESESKSSCWSPLWETPCHAITVFDFNREPIDKIPSGIDSIRRFPPDSILCRRCAQTITNQLHLQYIISQQHLRASSLRTAEYWESREKCIRQVRYRATAFVTARLKR